ncbi:MAG: HAMP domain-containing histidine kinase [Planctomycetes bacterium]|nr:HAMP domain-containing histidine kinase [Planctomycetota bacterium]
MSLASRFLLTLVVSAVLPLLIYGWFSQRSMRAQIDEQVVRVFLPQLAADHAQKVEALLQRTDQACSLVREIARRVLAAPPAARKVELEAFAEQVELVPDLLANYLDLLLLADADGRVVYWQDGQRLDPNTHERRAALIPAAVADADWFQLAQRERGLHFLPWGRSPYLHRGLDHRSMDPGSHHLGLALDVPRPDGAPGVLFALMRWSEVQLVLDQARAVLADRAALPSAEVFLVSRAGVVQGHTDRARYGLPVAPDELARQLTTAGATGRAAFADARGRRWRVGFSPCGNGVARSFVIAVAVPESELFAASDTFERILLAAILVTLLVLLIWSLVASRAITAPVQALVAASRRIAGGDLAVAVPPRGGPELGELAGAFNQMAADLAAGRERLAAAQRDQAWAEMARQVAHEVKNPLQPMRMAAQLLQRARSEQDPRADLVAERLARTVLEQTEALDRIASDFRAFAGSAPQQQQVVAVAEWFTTLREQLAGLFAGKPVAIEVDAGAVAARVTIDGKALGRVFVNLVQNAHEAAPQGVRVRIGAAMAGGKVAITVQDDGPGIPEAVRGRLFEPYFTTKTSGTGLGLAICRRLLEAHGGGIKLLRSGPGETVFELVLPGLVE